MKVSFKLSDGTEMPSYAHSGDAGLDLRVKERVIVPPHETIMVSSGVSAAIPRAYAGLVMMRSGVSRDSGICLANGVGLIDSGYRGEIGLPLHNLTDVPVELFRGERVAQLVVVPVMDVECVRVDELPKTERGERGFGSTGKE